jgi:hypothetical protein
MITSTKSYLLPCIKAIKTVPLARNCLLKKLISRQISDKMAEIAKLKMLKKNLLFLTRKNSGVRSQNEFCMTGG